jgi:hypothetical protein
MPGQVRIGGVWRDVSNISVRVGGTWREVQQGWARIAGVWREFFTASDYQLIASTTLTVAGNVVFTGIPQNFRHLELHISGRRNVAGLTTDRLRINNISTNSYYWAGAYGNQQQSPTDTTIATGAPSSFYTIGFINDSADSAQFSQSRVLINDYTSNKKKTIVSIAATTNAGTISNVFSGTLDNTGAITELFMFVANFYAAGSKFYLYGVK